MSAKRASRPRLGWVAHETGCVLRGAGQSRSFQARELLLSSRAQSRPPQAEASSLGHPRRWHTATRTARWLVLLHGLVLHLMAAPVASAEPDVRTRWIPGVSFGAGARVIPVDSVTVSSLRGDFEGEGNRVFGTLGLDLHLRSPTLTTASWAPRVFARVGVAALFDEEDRIVNEAAPGPIVIPIIDNNNDGIPDVDPPVATAQGPGSATGARSDSPFFTAAVGLDFELALLGSPVHVKPSFEWIWEQDRVTTVVGYVESAGADPSLCGPCRTLFAQGENVDAFHGIGPGLEIEFDSGQAGPFSTSVFLQTQVYYILDRKVDVMAQAEFDDMDRIETVRGRYIRSRWDYRFGVGLRLDWSPDR